MKKESNIGFIVLLVMIVLIVLALVLPTKVSVSLSLDSSHVQVNKWEDNEVTCRILTPSVSAFGAGLNGIAISCMLKEHNQTLSDTLTFPRAMESSL